MGNLNGKMNLKIYIQQIFPEILDEFYAQGFILIYDYDLAYLSKETDKWVKANGLKVLSLPGVLPDFSIFELLIVLFKRRFYTRRSAS